jgi:hypothetical protein
MTRLQRSTPAGQAYLDLQRLARRSGRSIQALLPMFASERWLARLAASPHRSRFVLKGGVLLAALGNRRPTQDADLLALNIANDHDTVIGYTNDVALVELADGMGFDPSTTTAATTRDTDLYLGVRLSMDCTLASAKSGSNSTSTSATPSRPGRARSACRPCSTGRPSKSSATRSSRSSPRSSAPQCSWARPTLASATTSTCTTSPALIRWTSGRPAMRS